MIIDQTTVVKAPEFTAWWTQSHAPNGEPQIGLQLGNALNLILTPTELGALAQVIADTLRIPAADRNAVEIVSLPMF